MDNLNVKDIKKFATQIRMETVKEIAECGFGHIGGALSVTDVIAVLYSGVMRVDSNQPNLKGRDKLVMSKGHAGPALYAALALRGFFPMEMLKTLNKPGTKLPSHCDRQLTPGIDMTTGSLGQGVSSAIGLALAQKMDGEDSRTYLFVGDGELNEGQVWEGAMFAPFHKLDNLTMFVDCNDKQLDGTTKDVLDLGDVPAKFKAFGWNVITIDGHDVEAIIAAIDTAHKTKDVPTCVVMNTVKGKGVKFVEEMDLNHHITMNREQEATALAQLELDMEAIERGDV